MSLLMDSSLVTPPPPLIDHLKDDEKGVFIFDSNLLEKQSKLPNQFIWPLADLIHSTPSEEEELKEPLIDLGGFRRGDEVETAQAAELIRSACLNHGFFQVTNHGIDQALIYKAYNEIDAIFKMPVDKKLSIKKKLGSVSGYSGAHTDRYSSKLPWKETFSFEFHGNDGENHVVVDYFQSLGDDFEHTGWVYQKYCEAMNQIALDIMELLAISVGVDRLLYRKFFEDGRSIMRCNYYPPCQNSGLALGTGPHSDPTSLTILHQDQVGGLQVFADNKWKSVRPRPDALVVNIGDTFKALCNGRYKSCLHRAVVNRNKERRSLVLFVCPREDRVVRPPEDLISEDVPRKYPDFTWSQLLEFTQKHYRADVSTLQSFINWLSSSKVD